MIDISVNSLVKSFELGKNILDELSFTVNSGEILGIAGVRYIYYASRSRAHPFFRHPSLAHRSASRYPGGHGLPQPGAQPNFPARASARAPAALIARASRLPATCMHPATNATK